MSERYRSTRRRLEAALADFAGRKHCVLTGSGCTAIYLALKEIEQQHGAGEVIVPSVVCHSVPQVVSYAGFKPVFCDVRRDDFTLDPASVAALVRPATRAVIPVHIFGHSARMDEVLKAVARQDIWVIEDAAQSIGGSYDGRRHGGWGDFSVLSFGPTKIISAGVGGALLTDSEDLAIAASSRLQHLPEWTRSSRRALRTLSQRNLYHACVDLLRTDAALNVSQTFTSAFEHYRELYLCQFPEEEALLCSITDGLLRLHSQLQERLNKASSYSELLSSDGLTHSRAWRKSGVVWRYTLLVNDALTLKHVTEQLRRGGIHASNHYWSAADLFYGQKDLTRTNHVCPRLLNLWVDDCANDEYIRRTRDIVLRALAERIPESTTVAGGSA